MPTFFMKNILSSLVYLLFLFPIFIHSIELKIASYNVENLFDMHHDKTEYLEYVPNRHNWTGKILEKKLKNISEVICELNSDIIGLQEIENQNSLRLLQQSLKKYGCYDYRYSAITTKKNIAINVALLSKIPIKSYRDIVVKRAGGMRNILEVKFIIEGKPLYIFVNHWNSKRSPESKRIISALVLKKRLMELKKESEYLLIGDFNSNYNEHKRNEHKRVGKTGINHVLNSMLFREESMQKKIDFKHYNLWLELLPYQRWSHNFYGDKQGLDAILLPPTLFDGKGFDYLDNSFGVFKRNYLFTKKGYVNRWLYKKKRHIGKGYSDHFPVFATFSTTPYKFKKKKTMLNCSIADILNQKVSLPCHLKRVRIIDTQKRAVTVTDKSSKVIIYGVDKSIKENHFYEVDVYQTKIYKGRFEIIDFTMNSLDN